MRNPRQENGFLFIYELSQEICLLWYQSLTKQMESKQIGLKMNH